jgi:hypothetical protein
MGPTVKSFKNAVTPMFVVDYAKCMDSSSAPNLEAYTFDLFDSNFTTVTISSILNGGLDATEFSHL